jgi:hypothetical protein
MPSFGSMKVSWDDGQARSKADAEATRALTLAAEHLLAKANDTVPIEEGTLARSGSVDVDGRAGEATVSYDTPYALRLHENPQYAFKHGRRGKWLELTLQEQAAAIMRVFSGIRIG